VVDGDLVVEGHHRVMAAKKAGVDIVTTPGTATTVKKQNALDSFDDIKGDPVDWY
jgi:ParB-like chromosome segregation protein Spo0J